MYRLDLKIVALVNEVFQRLSPGLYFRIASPNETLLPVIRFPVSQDCRPKVFNLTVSLDLGSGWDS